MKICKEYTSHPHSILTIDTTLPADNPLRLQKSFRFIKKMTLTDELKILDNKIKANQAQCNLDRKAAKIFALSSKESDKYLTGEDLGYTPGVTEQAKFEYSPLGKVFNKGLDGKDRKEGLLKRLKNLEGKNKLKMIKNSFDKANENAFKRLNFISKLSPDSREIFYKIKKLDKKIDYAKLVCVHKNVNIYDSTIFRGLGDFIRSIYYADILIEQAMDKKYEMEELLRSLDTYRPQRNDKNNQEKKLLIMYTNFLKEEK